MYGAFANFGNGLKRKRYNTTIPIICKKRRDFSNALYNAYAYTNIIVNIINKYARADDVYINAK